MDKITKFLLQLNKKDKVFWIAVLRNLVKGKLSSYDIIALKGYKNLYRLNHGKIRLVFEKIDGKCVVVNLAYRKDIYIN